MLLLRPWAKTTYIYTIKERLFGLRAFSKIEFFSGYERTQNPKDHARLNSTGS